MFSKTITNSSQFLMMPQSSQNLYFHLGMNADDDGFCEHFALMRMTDSKPDDLKVLQAKGFVSVFDDRVLVITDWKENNYLRSDRYTPSKYLEIYKQELALISGKSSVDTVGIPVVHQMATQDRIGKDRLGEVKDKKRYGELQNVSLSDEEHQKLIQRYGRSATAHLIEELSTYIGSSGKRYKDHYATLLNWARRKNVVEVKQTVAPAPVEEDISPAEALKIRQRMAEISKKLNINRP